jgi:hypothetical protein
MSENTITFENRFPMPNIPAHQIWRKVAGEKYLCDHNHQYSLPADVVETSDFFQVGEKPEYSASRMIAFAKFCLKNKKEPDAVQLEEFIKHG